MKSVIKKKLMYSLIIPYIITGIIAVALFGGVQIKAFLDMKEKIINKEIEMIKGVTREIDYLISDIQRIVVDCESNSGLWQLRNIDKQMDATDKYNISVAINKLKKVNSYNRFIKQLYVYYQQGDFITSGENYYKNNIAYEKFHELGGVTYEEWYEKITGEYAIGELKKIGNELCYIITATTLGEKNRSNIVIILDENTLRELIDTYNTQTGTFYLKNNSNELVFTNVNKIEKEFWNENNEKVRKKYLYRDEEGTECLQVTADGKRYIMLQNNIKRIRSQYIVVVSNEIFMQDISNSILILVSAIICFITLLTSGIYIIHRKYKVVDSLIQKLKDTYDFEEFKNGTYSEMEYIENILNNLKGAVKAQKGLVLEGILRKSLQDILEADEEVYTYLECNGEDFSNKYFITAIIAESKPFQKVTDNRLNEFIIANTLEETFKDIAKIYTMILNNNYVVVISVKEVISEDKLKKITDCLDKLKIYWEQKFAFNCIMSLSKPYTGLSNTFFAYKEVKKSLEYKIFFGKNEITYPVEVEEINKPYEYSTEIEAQLINYLKMSESQKSVKMIKSLFETNIKKNNLSVESVKDLIREIGSTLDKVGKAVQYDTKLISGEFFARYETINEMMEQVNEMVMKICMKIESQKKGISKVERIINYIHENYQDLNLNVSSIADIFEMNSSYLSRLFKEQTGENLLSFINQYRVEKIKILLIETSLTLDEIGKRVGFINSVAVIRAFKKCEGITPTQYKNIHVK